MAQNNLLSEQFSYIGASKHLLICIFALIMQGRQTFNSGKEYG